MQASDWPAATPSARCQPCRGRRGAGRWLLGPKPIDGNDEAGGRSDDAEHAQRQAQFEVFQVSLGCEVFVGALEPAHAVTKRAVSIPGSALISPAVMVALRCERSTLPLRVTFVRASRRQSRSTTTWGSKLPITVIARRSVRDGRSPPKGLRSPATRADDAPPTPRARCPRDR